MPPLLGMNPDLNRLGPCALRLEHAAISVHQRGLFDQSANGSHDDLLPIVGSVTAIETLHQLTRCHS